MSNSGYLSSQKMSFFARERRIALNVGIKITGKDMLDHFSPYHVNWFDIRKLNPVS
jgi:hypothetical protein